MLYWIKEGESPLCELWEYWIGGPVHQSTGERLLFLPDHVFEGEVFGVFLGALGLGAAGFGEAFGEGVGGAPGFAFFEEREGAIEGAFVIPIPLENFLFGWVVFASDDAVVGIEGVGGAVEFFQCAGAEEGGAVLGGGWEVFEGEELVVGKERLAVVAGERVGLGGEEECLLLGLAGELFVREELGDGFEGVGWAVVVEKGAGFFQLSKGGKGWGVGDEFIVAGEGFLGGLGGADGEGGAGTAEAGDGGEGMVGEVLDELARRRGGLVRFVFSFRETVRF